MSVAIIASGVAEWSWLALLLLVPAAFDPAGALAFEPLKASLLRGMAAVASAAWLVRRASEPGGFSPNAVVRAGLSFIVVLALATALSIEPAISFFGGFERGMGWLTVASGGVLLLSAADLFADEARRERAITALLIGAVVPCAYFLVQRVGFDPIVWNALGAPGSTLASPTFLGGYLVMLAPLALYRAVSSARTASFAYAGWLALLLVLCTVIVLTTIRAPLLGLVAGLCAFVGLASPRRRIGRLEIGAAIAILLAALVLAFVATGASSTTGLQRFLGIARAGDSSVERLTAWRDSVRLLSADPERALIGFGPDTQQAVLEHGEATVRLTQNQQWDRAHDLWLDTWLTAGALGVAALVWLLWTAAGSAWRARGEHRLLVAAVLAALLGHLVEVSFAFHSVTTELVFWFLIGLAASLTPRRAGVKQFSPRVAVFGALAAIAVVPLLTTPAVADALYGNARRSNYVDGAYLEETAANWAPWVEELPRAAGLDWQRVASIRSDETARRRAEKDLLLAAARAPAEPLPQLRLTRWFLLQGDASAAEAACERALQLGPYRATVWDACADAALALGRTDLAPQRRARGQELRQPLT